MGVLTNLGNIALFRQDFDRARELYDEGARLAKELGSTFNAATTAHDLGLIELAVAVWVFPFTLTGERGDRDTAFWASAQLSGRGPGTGVGSSTADRSKPPLAVATPRPKIAFPRRPTTKRII